MSRTNDAVGMAASAIVFLTDLGLGWPGVQNFLNRLIDEKPGKVGYAPNAGCTPILSESFGITDFGPDRFSLRFDWRIGEVFASKGESDQRVLYPNLTELASGRGLPDLIAAINRTGGEPWVVVRSANFFFDLFPASEEGRVAFEAFHRIDPADWWTEKGVTDQALTRMRPGGLLWRDMNEAVSASDWILLGVE